MTRSAPAGALDDAAAGAGIRRRGEEILAEISGTFAFDAPLAFAWCPPS